MSDAARELLRAHVIAALDTDTADEALALARELAGVLGWVKIGSKLFTSSGPALLDALGELGLTVFLDLKYHDIPSVVGAACERAARHPAVGMLTVHASGGRDMIRRAREGARAGRPGSPPSVVAVTALTSLSGEDVAALGIEGGVEAWVERLAALAIDAGADGLVCSAREAAHLRARHPAARLVTPGIRPAAQMGRDDQARAVTPADALAAGSSHLVIGRPIYRADDPVAAALAIGDELTKGGLA
jgi:orotidine-5'-phosphate decarboxylase